MTATITTDNLPEALLEKYERLQTIFKDIGRTLVAYSGGVDSTLVARIAFDVLGAENTLAVIAISPSLGRDEERDLFLQGTCLRCPPSSRPSPRI